MKTPSTLLMFLFIAVTLFISCTGENSSPIDLDAGELTITRVEALTSGDTLKGFLISGTGFVEFMTARLDESFLAYEYDSETLARIYLSTTVEEGTHNIYLAKEDAEVSDSITILRGTDGKGIEWQGSLDEAPSDPDTNWAYYNSRENTAYIYDGDSWQILISGVEGLAGKDGKSIVWKGSRTTPPSDPDTNWAYFNTGDKVTFIYNGEDWDTMAVSGADGSDGTNGSDGSDGQDGLSILWQGSADTPLQDPEEGWAYFNTENNVSFIYRDGSWDTLAVSGTDGSDGADGQDGKSLVWLGTRASAPADPDTGWAYFNTTDKATYLFNGESWDTLAVSGQDGATGETGERGEQGASGADGIDGIPVVWQGMHESAPADPELNWAYYNSKDEVSYIYDGTEWDTMVVSGIDGQDGSDGLPLLWQGSLASAPADPQTNWAYFNQTDRVSYVYDGSEWDTLAVSGRDGAAGRNGSDGLSINWLGSMAFPPLLPDHYDAYYNTGNGNSYIYIDDGRIGSWQLLAQGGEDFDPSVDTIHVSQITGLLGQGFTLSFPDVTNNSVRLDIAALPLTDRVIINTGPGVEIDRIHFQTGDRWYDESGLSEEYPFIFETGGTDAEDIKTYFDEFVAGTDHPRAMSIIFEDVMGTERFRFNLFEFSPQSYEDAPDGRTRFTFENTAAPDNVWHIQEEGLSSDDYGEFIRPSFDPATESPVEISGIGVTGEFAAVPVIDTVVRTITIDYTVGETNLEFYDWTRAILANGTSVEGTKSMSILHLEDTPLDPDRPAEWLGTGWYEHGRTNYYEVFPVSWEFSGGYRLHYQLTARIVLAYGWSEEG